MNTLIVSQIKYFFFSGTRESRITVLSSIILAESWKNVWTTDVT